MMFRRKDEDDNEYLIQPVNKSFNNNNNSGFATPSGSQSYQPQQGSTGQLFGQNVSLQNNNSEPQQHVQSHAVPYVKTNSANVLASYDTPPPAAQKAEVHVKEHKEAKEPKAQKPVTSASVNNFVPSAVRASSTQTSNQNQSNQPVQNSATSQIPSFNHKSSNISTSASALKIDNLGFETERRLTVGYGISLEGKVSDCDKLVIYGLVHAELNNVKALQISDSGKFRGAAEVDFAEISGVFEGELKVRKSIVISATGRVSGKITYGSIEIKPGGKFTGEIVEDLALSGTASGESDEQNALNQDYNLFIDQKSENKAA